MAIVAIEQIVEVLEACWCVLQCVCGEAILTDVVQIWIYKGYIVMCPWASTEKKGAVLK